MDGLSDAISLSHAATYGLVDHTTKELPEYAFPDPVKYGKYPYIYNDDAEWVSVILGGVTKVPNTRIKTLIARGADEEHINILLDVPYSKLFDTRQTAGIITYYFYIYF